MSLAIAYSGSAVYSAKFATPGVSHIVNKKVASDSKKTYRKLHVVIASLLMLALSVSIFAGIGTKKASANWFSDAIKDVFCSTSAWFNEPTASHGGWFAAFSNSPVGKMAGSATNPVRASLAHDPTFLDTRRTAYEKFGMAGTNWTVYAGEREINEGVHKKTRDYFGDRKNGFKDGNILENTVCVPVTDLIFTVLANNIFNMTKFVTTGASWVLTHAFSPDWIDDLMDNVNELIEGKKGQDGLRDTLYYPFFGIMMIFAALWLLKEALIKQRIMSSVQGIIWMLVIAGFGGMFLYSPSLLPGIVNEVTTEVSGAIIAGTAGNAGSTEEGSLCYSGGVGKKSSADVKRNAVIKTTECRFWETFVFSPWVIGQFGVPYNNATLTGIPKNAHAVKMGGGTELMNLALIQLDNQVLDPSEQGTDTYNKNLSKFYYVVDETAKTPEIFTTWKGSDATNRILIAVSSLVAAIAALILVFVLSISMLIYSLGLVILTYFAIFFLLIGLHPGMGRRLMMKWLELYAEAVIKKMIIAAIIGIMLIFYGVILEQSSDDWQQSILAIVILSVGLFMYRKELLGLASNLNFGSEGAGSQFGGEKFQGLTESSKRATAGVALGAVGASGAAGAAAKTAANMNRKGGFSAKLDAAKAATKTVGAGAGRGLLSSTRGMDGLGGIAASVSMGSGQAAGNRAATKVNRESQETVSVAHEEAIRANKEFDERRMNARNAAHEEALRDEAAMLHGPALEENKAHDTKVIAAKEEAEKQRVLEIERSKAAAGERKKKAAEVSEKARQQKFDSSKAKNSPEAVAARAELVKRNALKYRKDFSSNRDNAQWVSAFEQKYHMTPPDPELYDFRGYGLVEELQKDASLLPTRRNLNDLTQEEAVRDYGGISAPTTIKESEEDAAARQELLKKARQRENTRWMRQQQQPKPGGMPRPVR